MARLAEGFPLSCRLLREIQSRLLERGRGTDRLPGEFRRSQNWIGGTRPSNASLVQPPPALVEDCMAQLEQFIHGGQHGEHSLPVLVRAALAHVQFETIHPFLDGNGRLGQLLIVLMLIDAGVLHQPLLYLSLFFKQHRSRYYELLDGVRQQGDWEAWIDFFLEGVESTAAAAVAAAPGPGPIRSQRAPGLCGPAPAAAHQHKAAQRAERAELPNRSQGDREPGGARHRPGDHGRATQSTVCLRRLPGDSQRGH